MDGHWEGECLGPSIHQRKGEYKRPIVVVSAAADTDMETRGNEKADY